MDTYTYMVLQGDTARLIAAKHGLTVRELLSANPQYAVRVPLIPGELLLIPRKMTRRYIVQPGDTKGLIAVKFGCSETELLELNPCLYPNREVELGMTLDLPEAKDWQIIRTDREYGPDSLSRDLRKLQQAFPFLQVKTIGRSVTGKPIYAAGIGEGPYRLQVNAAVHANEWITSLVLMVFLEMYGRACRRKGKIGGKDAALLFSRCTMWTVPMVNPDGVELVQEGLEASHPFYEELLAWNRGSQSFRKWKANARGIDLNDQFPAHWDTEAARRSVPGPGPRDYGGTSPLSEPEAKALADFTESMDFQAVIALHTQGEEIYWNYRGYEPPEAKAWAEQLGHAAGYRPVELTGSDAGFKDWFIQEYRRPGFTVELGSGRNPLPLTDFAELLEDGIKLLTEALDFGG